jgi:hypothetical protein
VLKPAFFVFLYCLIPRNYNIYVHGGLRHQFGSFMAHNVLSYNMELMKSERKGKSIYLSSGSSSPLCLCKSPAQDATAFQPDTPHLYTPAEHTPPALSKTIPATHEPHARVTRNAATTPANHSIYKKLSHVTISYNNEISLIIT